MHYLLFRDRLEDASGQVLATWQAEDYNGAFAQNARRALRKARNLRYLYLAEPLSGLSDNPALRNVPLGEGLVNWRTELASTYPDIPPEDITAVHYPRTEGVLIQGFRKSLLQQILAGRSGVCVVPLPLLLAHLTRTQTEPPAVTFLVRKRYLATVPRPYDDIESAYFTSGQPITEEDVLRELQSLGNIDYLNVYFAEPGARFDLAGYAVRSLPVFQEAPPEGLCLPEVARPPVLTPKQAAALLVATAIPLFLLVVAPGNLERRLEPLRTEVRELQSQVARLEAQQRLLERLRARERELKTQLARAESGERLAGRLTKLAQAFAPYRAGITQASVNSKGLTMQVEAADLPTAQKLAESLTRAFGEPRIANIQKREQGYTLSVFLPLAGEETP